VVAGLAIALAPPKAVIAPRHDARMAVCHVLSESYGFQQLHPKLQTAIAGSLAQIGSTALDVSDATSDPPASVPLAQAQNAGTDFSGTAVDRVAGTTRNLMNSVSFPRFVNELITGVFKAMNDSNQQQLTAFVDLIRNVAQSTEGFADANVGVSGARDWLVEHFPGSYQIDGGDEVDLASELEGLDPAAARERRAELQAEKDASTRLIMRPGGQPPTEAALRTALGAPQGTPLNPSDPEAMLPLARQVLAANRQQLLATMIQMGLQRIVIESGRVHAAMKLHVDARSSAENDRGSQFDMRNTSEVGVGAKVGPWGAEAKIQNTIGYVSTDRTQTTEGINASVDLDSGVELVFKTDYVPLNRLAGVGDVERIRVNTLNPDAEAQRLTSEANVRTAAAATRSAERTRELDAALHTPPPLPAATINTANLRAGTVTAPTVTPPLAVVPAPAVTPVAASAPVSAARPATGVAPATAPAHSPAAPVPSPAVAAAPASAAGPATSVAPATVTRPGAGVVAPPSPVSAPAAIATPSHPNLGAAIGSGIGSLIGGDAGAQVGGAIAGLILR
jgi:hypothetical protein